MSSVKVVQMTSLHHALDPRIFHKITRTLHDAGYDVSLVAPLAADETVNGIRIVAVHRAPTRLSRLGTTIWRVYLAARREQGSIYHFHDPELLPISILLKLGGAKVIYDVHEDYPKDIMSKAYLPAPVRGPLALLVRTMERLCYRMLDGFVCATPGIAARFPGPKTTIVRNFPVLSELICPNPVPYRDRPRLAVYVGAIAHTRGIAEVVQAMDLIDPRKPTRLAVAGEFGEPGLEAEVRQLPGWAHVDYLGFLLRPDVAHLLGRVRVGLVTLHPTPAYLESLPVKLFEYMASGVPVVASNFPQWKELVEGSGCGIMVDPRDVSAVARAIEWLLDNEKEAEEMGQRGREAARARFNWDTEAASLLSLYQRLADKPMTPKE